MESKFKNHRLVCEDRKSLCITGVEKADNATPTQFSCIVLGRPLIVTGKGLSVKRLDIVEGIAELAGEINEIKYAHEKKSLLSRIFK